MWGGRGGRGSRIFSRDRAKALRSRKRQSWGAAGAVGGAGWHPQGRRAQPVPGLHWPSLQHDEWANSLFPTASHKGLHHWMWGQGHRRRGEAILKDNPDAQPLHSQEGGPGLGAQCLGSLAQLGTSIC